MIGDNVVFNLTKIYFADLNRCRKYNNLPQQCILQQSVADACCMEPHCDFSATGNSFTGAITLTMAPITPQPITTTPRPTSPKPSK